MNIIGVLIILGLILSIGTNVYLAVDTNILENKNINITQQYINCLDEKEMFINKNTLLLSTQKIAQQTYIKIQDNYTNLKTEYEKFKQNKTTIKDVYNESLFKCGSCLANTTNNTNCLTYIWQLQKLEEQLEFCWGFNETINQSTNQTNSTNTTS